MKLRITLDGKSYDVEVEIEDAPPVTYAQGMVASAILPVAMPAPAAAPAGTAIVSEEKVCRSPMVGIVVRVTVHEGEMVAKDDPLLVLEAMKMETMVTSPVAGKVKAVPVAAGESVQAGQVLVEFE